MCIFAMRQSTITVRLPSLRLRGEMLRSANHLRSVDASMRVVCRFTWKLVSWLRMSKMMRRRYV